MITAEQKNQLLSLIAAEFTRQRGFKISPEELDMEFQPPFRNSVCTVMINTKRTDDFLRFLVVVRGFAQRTSLNNFYLSQLQNYASGNQDEVQVVDATLGTDEYKWLLRLTQSKKFIDEVVYADKRMYFDNGDYLLFENGTPVLFG